MARLPARAARGKPVDHGGQPEKDDKGRIPSRVEDVAGDEKIDLLDSPRKGHGVEEENDGEEDDEDQGIKDHGAPPDFLSWQVVARKRSIEETLRWRIYSK